MTHASLNGTFYWTQRENVDINGQLSPTLTFDIVRVPGAAKLNATDTYFSRIDQNPSSNNISVSTGGTWKFLVRPEVTTSYTGLRRPVFAHELNTSAWETVSMPGLQEVTCPSGIITATNERSLFKCFDSGYEWFVDAGSKAGIPNTLYGYKDFQVEVKAKPSVDPTNIAGHADVIYLLDRDEDYRNAPGQLFFLDPSTSSTNLGWTTNSGVTVFPS